MRPGHMVPNGPTTCLCMCVWWLVTRLLNFRQRRLMTYRIAANAARLIADGSTLQVRVGKIPDAILSSLSHARNLGIHSASI